MVGNVSKNFLVNAHFTMMTKVVVLSVPGHLVWTPGTGACKYGDPVLA
jgi:hypothetical protein